MAITTIVGFDDVARLKLSGLTDFTAIENTPFKALTDSVGGHEVDSTFRFTVAGERGWLTTQPQNSDRRPLSYCYCSDSYSYANIYKCYARTRAHSEGNTNNKRYKDSSLRTPCLGVDLADVFPDHITDYDVDVFRFGVRVYFNSGSLEGDHFLDLAIPYTGDNPNRYRTNALRLFSKTEINEAMVQNKVYLEVEINRRTGVVRRWVDSVEQSWSTLNHTYMTSFTQLRLQFGEKSREVGGENYRRHTNDFNQCPSEQTFTGGYSYDAGAPQDQHFSLTDFYFMADTSSSDIGRSHNDRLGDIEVRDLEVSSLLINQHWTPYPGESPATTVNRQKVNDNARSGIAVTGDTNANDATVIWNPLVYNLNEEVIYSEFRFWAAPENAQDILELSITPYIGASPQPNVRVELPTGDNYNPASHYLAVALESDPVGDSLESTILNRLQFKVGFDVPS